MPISVEIVNTPHQREFLDATDKTLHTACHNQGVSFEWPNCSSGKSCDELDESKKQRQNNLRALLEQARKLSRKKNNRTQPEPQLQNAQLNNIVQGEEIARVPENEVIQTLNLTRSPRANATKTPLFGGFSILV